MRTEFGKEDMKEKLPFSSPRNGLDNINNDPIVVVTEMERCVQMI